MWTWSCCLMIQSYRFTMYRIVPQVASKISILNCSHVLETNSASHDLTVWPELCFNVPFYSNQWELHQFTKSSFSELFPSKISSMWSVSKQTKSLFPWKVKANITWNHVKGSAKFSIHIWLVSHFKCEQNPGASGHSLVVPTRWFRNAF